MVNDFFYKYNDFNCAGVENMNIEKIGQKCYGCSACYAICPCDAIKMTEDNEGFIVPKIENTKCIHCGRCYKICPALEEPEANYDNKIYAGFHNNYEVWSNSSSGGAFCAICEIFGDEETYVFGAKFDYKTKAIEHSCVKNVSLASEFSGSKYVQSSNNESFKEIRELLRNNKVIYAGTPCQVAGLLSFLRDIDSSNLLTISVMCNGVGSPKVFRDYLNAIEREEKSRILDYRFRNKNICLGIHNLYRSTVVFESGKKISSNKDKFVNCYLQKIVCRPSCFSCPYNDVINKGDIIIGDFKKQYDYVKNAPYDRNGSIIISHTDKGDSVCRQLENLMTLYPVNSKSYDYPVHGDYNKDLRDLFFKEYDNNEKNVILLLKKFAIKPKILIQIWGCVPDFLRGRIKRFLKR